MPCIRPCSFSCFHLCFLLGFSCFVLTSCFLQRRFLRWAVLIAGVFIGRKHVTRTINAICYNFSMIASQQNKSRSRKKPSQRGANLVTSIFLSFPFIPHFLSHFFPFSSLFSPRLRAQQLYVRTFFFCSACLFDVLITFAIVMVNINKVERMKKMIKTTKWTSETGKVASFGINTMYVWRS